MWWCMVEGTWYGIRQKGFSRLEPICYTPTQMVAGRMIRLFDILVADCSVFCVDVNVDHQYITIDLHYGH
jgi:hypothetical protein